MFNDVQLRELTWLSDTIIYRKALEMAVTMKFTIKNTKLSKFLDLIESLDQDYSTDHLTNKITSYVKNQKDKSTINKYEQSFYASISDFIRKDEIEKEMITGNKVFSDCIQHDEDSKKIKKEKREKIKTIRDILLKHFIVCLVVEMKVKGAESGK